MSRHRPPKDTPKAATAVHSSSVPLYIAFLCVFGLMMLFEALLSRQTFSETAPADLTEFDKKQVDTFIETNKLLTTLATLLIGATTGLLLNSEKIAKLQRSDFRRAVACWVTAASSLYFGHLAYRQLLWMLHNHFLNILNGMVWWPARMQFWSFLASAVLLSDFIYRIAQKRVINDISAAAG